MEKNLIQLALFVPKPGQRPPGWIQYRDKVVVIHFATRNSKHPVEIRRGHITSYPGSHGGGFKVDNVKKTIVLFDRSYRIADSADDEHEMSFNPQDPHLLKIDEVDRIRRDFEFAIDYFEEAYPADVVRVIVDTLLRCDLGETREQAGLRELREQFGESVVLSDGKPVDSAEKPANDQRRPKSWWHQTLADGARNACTE